MTPEWVGYLEKCYGDSDPNGNEDTFGRANKQIWGNFTAYNTAPALGTGEHDRDGAHMSDLASGLWVVEEGTYTGTSVDNRNISFSDAGLDCKFMRIWTAQYSLTYFRSEDMTGDNTKRTSNVGFLPDYIQSIATTGQFQVGLTLNVTGNTYYYVAYGVS